MSITCFRDLQQAARQENEPQRFLFVFCQAGVPDDATEAERVAYEQGEGGTLTPAVCVDKAPEEVESFENLVSESDRTGQHWDVVFAAAMSGRGGVAPGTDDAQQPLQMMVEAVRTGHIGQFVPFDRDGRVVDLEID